MIKTKKKYYLKRTPIKKVSEKQKIKNELKKEQFKDDVAFYDYIWHHRLHICEHCEKWLGNEPLLYYFDHILEKQTYPQFRYEPRNIWLLCFGCHEIKTTGNYTKKMKDKIEQTKKLLL
jgi:5-methylcytosine-specific restriction endonuclease McrA